MKTKIKQVIKKLFKIDTKRELLALDPQELRSVLTGIIRDKANSIPAFDALTFLLGLDSDVYALSGPQAIRYGNGVHTKHGHIRYHVFFMKNIKAGEKVLDIGSSNGELTSDIAKASAPGLTYGIEIDPEKTEIATKKYQMANLKFVTGDATKDLPGENFDVITMSNVLEHIEKRPEILRVLNEKYKPKRFIIRVPMFERDWKVPLKRELGLDYRLDETHYIEYTRETFTDEITQAGLKIDNIDIRWGEIWAILSSK
jgi:2-polyprenyl-3-methyl-5-hydroxy-6-metoxy-1,4-benzoquinol methylase